jgi:hypothetical protein
MAESNKARSASTAEASAASNTSSSESQSAQNTSSESRSSSSSRKDARQNREVLSPVGQQSSSEDWQMDLDSARTISTGGGQVYPGMSMPDIQGSAFDNPEVFDEYRYYESERVNNAEHLAHRFDERQIDWDLTARRDLDDDGVTSTGPKVRERTEFAKSRKSDQDR